ncbi:CHAP domain-containing protein [Winogradskyella sp. 3972H.M.0a.05]|uniref:CHAP domain-containing protein n=1 Tax=Winogradskyella sp. 3972H.M.0a.05 TaxID=2950277 RepID=UPI0033933EF7
MKANLITLLFLVLIFGCKKDNTKAENTIIEAQQPDSIVVEKPKQKQFKADNVGDTLDVHNDVYVIYNESVSNTSGRNLSADGYNLGLKWQCVEFVKRYYYEHLNHKMPNSYGHAKDFFNANVADGNINSERNLLQFTNGSSSKPEPDDLIIFGGNIFNSYGHVAIVSKVNKDDIEIVQQNVGNRSRDDIDLEFKNGKWYLDDSEILGWLRKR